MEVHEPQVDARRGWWALTNMATFFQASDVDALLHLLGCTIDEADDEGNTPLHHARRGPRRPKPTNISDCWKEFHRNLGLAESVFDYRHQSLSIPPSATAEILRGITEITSHKAMEHGVTFELRWQGWRIPFSTAPKMPRVS